MMQLRPQLTIPTYSWLQHLFPLLLLLLLLLLLFLYIVSTIHINLAPSSPSSPSLSHFIAAMKLGGVLLKSNSSLIRALEFLISLFVLGTFSYYIGVIHRNNLFVPTYIRAVEGIAGAAVIYTFLAVILTFFLGGVKLFAFLGIFLDLCFCGAFIAVAVLTRTGARSCSGRVLTPLGNGNASGTGIGGNRLNRICKLEKAIFAVAIANA